MLVIFVLEGHLEIRGTIVFVPLQWFPMLSVLGRQTVEGLLTASERFINEFSTAPSNSKRGLLLIIKVGLVKAHINPRSLWQPDFSLHKPAHYSWLHLTIAEASQFRVVVCVWPRDTVEFPQPLVNSFQEALLRLHHFLF